MSDFLNNINEETTEKKELESFDNEEFKTFRKSRLPFVVLISVLIVLGVGTLMFLNKPVQVLDFTNWYYEDINLWAEKNSVNYNYIEEYSSEIAEGNVIDQSLSSDESISSNDHITFIISVGVDPYEIISVPEFDSSFTKAQIESWIRENNIENYSFEYEESDDISVNYLIDFELLDTFAEEFNRSSEINFTISRDLEIEEIVMGNFYAQRAVILQRWAEQNEILVDITYQYSDIYDKDTIIDQSAEEGEEIEVGSTIEIVVSKGSKIVIPNFANMNDLDISAFGQDNGISISTLREYSNLTKGSFIWQSVASGNVVESGTRVKIYYSLGNNVRINSFINRSYVDFYNEIYDLNLDKANIKLNISYANSETVDPGNIISQSHYNEKVPVGTTIDIVISQK